MVIFYNAWVAVGLILFYLGPIEWPGARSPDVALYVGVCLVAFNVGVRLARGSGPRAPLHARRLIPGSGRAARLLVAFHGLLSMVYLYNVTGKSVLDPAAYSLDFGQVYSDYYDVLAVRVVGQWIVLLMLVKAAIFPFVLATVIDRFRNDRVVVAMFIAPLVASSLFRGTDKEIIDVLVLVFVAMYLYRLLTWRVVLGLSIVPFVGSMFLSRRMGRFGNDLPVCLPGSDACFDFNSSTARLLGDEAEIFSVFVANYVTNGYQGLAYAFRLPWQPNWGIGHLPPLKRAVCTVSDVVCANADYHSALTAYGWDSSTRWTSVYTVLANDLSFWLVPLYLLVLGVIFQRCRSMWMGSRDPLAGAALVMVTTFWVYSSANMQLAISLDWTVATIALLYVAPWRATRSARTPVHA